MSSAPSQPEIKIFVSSNADASGDGTAAKPFGSLAEVAKDFGLDAQAKRLSQARAVKIVGIDNPGSSVECNRAKRNRRLLSSAASMKA